MKKLIAKSLLLVAMFVFAGTISMKAQDSNQPANTELQQDQQEQIAIKDVPKVVQDSFKKDFEGIKIEKAYKVSAKEGINYMLVVTYENEKWSLKYDANGKYLEKTKIGS
ncbi:hypothetical protein [Ekhidna sp.]